MNLRLDRRKLALGAVGAYVVTAGVWIGLLHVYEAKATAPRELPEWHAFAACLVGPLEEGELPSHRIHDIAVGARRGKAAGEELAKWPLNCEGRATALKRALVESEPRAGTSSHAAWSCLARSVDTVALNLGLIATKREGAVDRAFDCARRFVAPSTSAASAGGGPIAPDVPRVLRVLPDLGEGWLEETDPFRASVLRTRLTHQHGYCLVPPAGPHARCTRVPDTLGLSAPALMLVPTLHETETFVLSVAPWGGAVHRLSDGRRLLGATPEERLISAFVGADGKVRALVRGEGDAALVSGVEGEEAPVRTPLPGVRDEAELVGEHLLWLDDASPRHLWVRPLADTTAVPTDLGPFGGNGLVGNVVTCSSNEVLWALTSGGAVRIDARGYGWHFVSLSRPAVSCSDGVLTVATAQVDAVRYQRCTETRCEDEKSMTLSLGENEHNRAAIALGDSVLVVKKDKGVRMRLAPIAKLREAEERVILHDESGSGVPVHRVQLQARHGVAYLVAHTGEGAQLVRIDGQGAVTPITPQ